MNQLDASQLLLDSLLESRLLVESMGEVSSFDRGLLRAVELSKPFNFSQKLGHLYEDALAVLLRGALGVDQVIRGMQVFKKLPSGGRQTLGEFDFLVRMGERWLHIELATKFYLGFSKVGTSYWPGPDARDNWERKRKHMRKHQFSLSHCEAGKRIIDELTGGRGVESKLLLYGCLFEPQGCAGYPAEDVSELAHRGRWLTREEYVVELSDREIVMIPKFLWPVADLDRLFTSLSRASKEEVLAASEHRCVMVSDGEQRFFVVSEEWLKMVREG